MQKLYILTYSQITGSDMSKSVKFFQEKAGLSPAQLMEIVREEGGQPSTIENPTKGVIADYKKGLIDTIEFVEKIRY